MPKMFSELLEFLKRLSKEKIAYQLKHHCEQSITVHIDVPGEKWEVDFFDFGQIWVEVFKSDGVVHDQSKLEEFFQRFSEPSP
jgi:hypothetical protein